MPSQNRGFHSISGLWPLSAVAAFLLLIPTLALGQEERAAPRAVPRVPIYDPGTPVQKKVLKNGITILVQEQRTSERVAGAVAARMGTVYESDDDAGRGQVLIKAMIAGTQKLKPVELALRLLAADAKLEAGVGPDRAARVRCAGRVSDRGQGDRHPGERYDQDAASERIVD